MRTPLPRWLWLPVGAALLFLVVPLVGVGVRLPWGRLPELLSAQASLDALSLSLRTCFASTAISVLLGCPLALALARARGAWAAVARVLTMLPMVLPPVVAGLALLVTLGRRGLLGASLSAFGVEIGFTTVAVVIAQAFVSMPYLVIALEGALRTSPAGFESAAAVLGATPTYVLRRVTLPLLGPALASATALAFARALGEFGATLTFAGSLQGTTRTLPLEIYLQRETDPDSALALSVVLIGLAIVVVGGAGWLTRLTQTSEGGPSERRRRGRRADVGVPDRAGAS
ncbi:ABC transporter permease [Nigerium sp.]|uniref:ABC transporter permease n=1 Tax=Nigerium sp. TaxID=2042655 RepID=UPI003221C5B1